MVHTIKMPDESSVVSPSDARKEQWTLSAAYRGERALLAANVVNIVHEQRAEVEASAAHYSIRAGGDAWQCHRVFGRPVRFYRLFGQH